MLRHNRFRTGKKLRKRRKVARTQRAFLKVDSRQIEMRIDVRRTVSGEMLERGNDALRAQSVSQRTRQACNTFGIVAERARTDHDVLTKQREVKHRCIVDVDAGAA